MSNPFHLKEIPEAKTGNFNLIPASNAETSNKITGCFTPNISIFLRKQQVIFTSKSFNIKVVFNYYRDLACKNPKQIQVCH